MDFLDVVVEGGDITMRLEEVHVGAGSPMVRCALRESGIGKETGAIIIGIQSADGRPRVDRSAGTSIASVVIEEGMFSSLLVMKVTSNPSKRSL